MSARFEIVRSDDLPSPRIERGVYRDDPQPWHARFVAANGRIVWTTEQYGRSSGARNAISSLLDMFDARFGFRAATVQDQWGVHVASVHMVDERAEADRVR